MARQASHRVPRIWEGVRWAMQPGMDGGGASRVRLVARALRATLLHGRAMRHWMAVVFELHSRSVIGDLREGYLRAVRPYVHRSTSYAERVDQLIDHMDWLETAFHRAAFEQIASGDPLVLCELTAPRGYDFMRLQLQQAPAQSPEGELLLTLTLQRSAEVQHKPHPVDAAVLAFSRFRIDNRACLVIGGVRGQRHPVQRMSPMELSQALQGWKAPVLLVRVAQEMARYWDLHLIGLDPAAHRLHGWTYQWIKRYREASKRIFASYDGLWDHFDSKRGPPGWVVIPLNSDEKLAATALSPEKRARQTRRADYWIRTRNVMRVEFKHLLQRANREPRFSHLTETMDRESMKARLEYGDESEPPGSDDSDDMVPSRVLETGPGSLI